MESRAETDTPDSLLKRIDTTPSAVFVHDSGHRRPTLLGALTLAAALSLGAVLLSSALGAAAAVLDAPSLWGPTVGLGVLGPTALLVSIGLLRRAQTQPTTLKVDRAGIRVTGWFEEPPVQPTAIEVRGNALVATGPGEFRVVDGLPPSELEWLATVVSARLGVPTRAGHAHTATSASGSQSAAGPTGS